MVWVLVVQMSNGSQAAHCLQVLLVPRGWAGEALAIWLGPYTDFLLAEKSQPPWGLLGRVMSLVVLPHVSTCCCQDGVTCLMLATQGGHTATAKVLMGAGADVSSANTVSKAGGREGAWEGVLPALH